MPALASKDVAFVNDSAVSGGIRAVARATLHYRLPDLDVLPDAVAVLEYAAEQIVVKSDLPLLSGVWRTFLSRFFRLGSGWQTPMQDSMSPTGAGIVPIGAAVSTPYGDGVVLRCRWGNHGVLEEDESLPAVAAAVVSKMKSKEAEEQPAGGRSKGKGKSRGRKAKSKPQAAMEDDSSASVQEDLPAVRYEILLNWGEGATNIAVLNADDV